MGYRSYSVSAGSNFFKKPTPEQVARYLEIFSLEQSCIITFFWLFCSLLDIPFYTKYLALFWADRAALFPQQAGTNYYHANPDYRF